MSLTRIGSIGINTGIKFSGLTTITTLNTSIDTLSIGGPVSIAGTLTYEDVTNIDAVGLITARNGIVVGSGITLSKDGDGCFTGVVTATSYAGSGANLTGIDTDLVSDTSPQLGGNLDVNTKNIIFGDSGGATDDRLQFGASQDLEIYHNGSASYIKDSGTGYLLVLASGFAVQNAAGSETIMSMVEDGAVDLYHNDSKKFETTSGGVSVTGGINLTTNLSLLDNGYLKLGTGDDLKLYHNGTDSFIDNATGGLKILGDTIRLKGKSADENMVVASVNGTVELYWDNAKKYETQEVGANFYGRSVDCQLRFKTSDGTTRGSIYAYNDNSIAFLDAAGSYSLRTNSDKSATFFNHAKPNADNSYDLGTSSLRWRNLYTTDLQLSNEGKSNDVDGTWGDYTIQEGESDLFLINNRSGKKYKFNLTEVS